MYYKVIRNLKKYYKNEKELIKRIELINNYFKLILIYKSEVIKINLQHHNGYIENLNY